MGRLNGAPEWGAFTASRQEAARLWNDLIVRHHRIRRLNWKWPSKARWQRWATGRYPGLSAQSAQSTQQLIGEFCAAVDSCRQLRKNPPRGSELSLEAAPLSGCALSQPGGARS